MSLLVKHCLLRSSKVTATIYTLIHVSSSERRALLRM